MGNCPLPVLDKAISRRQETFLSPFFKVTGSWWSFFVWWNNHLSMVTMVKPPFVHGANNHIWLWNTYLWWLKAYPLLWPESKNWEKRLKAYFWRCFMAKSSHNLEKKNSTDSGSSLSCCQVTSQGLKLIYEEHLWML